MILYRKKIAFKKVKKGNDIFCDIERSSASNETSTQRDCR